MTPRGESSSNYKASFSCDAIIKFQKGGNTHAIKHSPFTSSDSREMQMSSDNSLCRFSYAVPLCESTAFTYGCQLNKAGAICSVRTPQSDIASFISMQTDSMFGWPHFLGQNCSGKRTLGATIKFLPCSIGAGL